MSRQFADRRDAGRRVAELALRYRGQSGLVLGIPRGGVVVAAEVSSALSWPLSTVVAHKLGAPLNPELAIGAVAECGALRINHELAHMTGADTEYLQAEIARQQGEIKRRVELYRQGKPLPELTGQIAIVIDDGVATGYTAFTALEAIRSLNPHEVVFAIPVANEAVLPELEKLTDRVLCVTVGLESGAVGGSYGRFEPVSDEEVLAHLGHPSDFDHN